uniref:Uncharacterized protein n=1 Tax=Paramoeba aestuarina TaxID=180227 RepID=A0A7S4JMG0_9EUKA|mmetsp:Transcript_11704/g.17740  ORF Transcript_11704/g.17740 Transcript_11704/m.17740 type:complete len:250 (+) Transcript_11704:304-1053(+)|eukprot:CAMPEP_0201513792 /NCGR_PEP_ID=MMETSP0161_2-20130828/5770_1 /ASSEMBLY_ACC=CAM_ASM_000251 /TAXON_ID=180227 /ORGANISM="Neoparamoeba aestuarina, Strain SoJaBio B1-5/56/2" /LENGTH=249 /DNA_ID=CAMNT_0047910135 /DNA_START=598 /DNA_END=1347 /DNA_ORIENTATION=+
MKFQNLLLVFALLGAFVVAQEDEEEDCVCIASNAGWTIDCSNQEVMEAAFTLISNYGCDSDCSSSVCQSNFYIVQAHHDYCFEDDVPENIEKNFHDYEDSCTDCHIDRRYDPSLPDCPGVDCSDRDDAIANFEALIDNGCESDCSSSVCVASYRNIRSYHDNCEEGDLPQFIEEGIHDFEESCEDANCNVGEPDDDDLDASNCPAPDDDDDNNVVSIICDDDDDDNSAGAALIVGVLLPVAVLVMAVLF